MITVKLTSEAGRTNYSYEVRDINGELLRGGSECYSIGFMDEYAPAGKTGLQHWTEYYDSRAYEQISRDVLVSMLVAQAAEIERIHAAGVPYFIIACHRSQYKALAALERAAVSYAKSMRVQ